jgi:hypothetical protein
VIIPPQLLAWDNFWLWTGGVFLLGVGASVILISSLEMLLGRRDRKKAAAGYRKPLDAPAPAQFREKVRTAELVQTQPHPGQVHRTDEIRPC